MYQENLAVGSPVFEATRPETVFGEIEFRGNNNAGEIRIAVGGEIDESELGTLRFSTPRIRPYIPFLSGFLHGAQVIEETPEGFTIGSMGADNNLVPGTYIIKYQIIELG
jgi:hypothetical protein